MVLTCVCYFLSRFALDLCLGISKGRNVRLGGMCDFIERIVQQGEIYLAHSQIKVEIRKHARMPPPNWATTTGIEIFIPRERDKQRETDCKA